MKSLSLSGVCDLILCRLNHLNQYYGVFYVDNKAWIFRSPGRTVRVGLCERFESVCVDFLTSFCSWQSHFSAGVSAIAVDALLHHRSTLSLLLVPL